VCVVVVVVVAVVRLTAPPLDWTARWWPGLGGPTDQVSADAPPAAATVTPGVLAHTDAASTPRPASPTAPPPPSSTGGGITVTSPSPPPPQVLAYEAESAELNGWASSHTLATASGGRIVGFIGDRSRNTVRFTVTVPSAGQYPMTVYYASAYARDFLISVNGAPPTVLSCVPTGSWEVIGSVGGTLVLAAGANSVQFGNPTRWAPDLDRITVTVPSQ
jgi:hypothetical protein